MNQVEKTRLLQKLTDLQYNYDDELLNQINSNDKVSMTRLQRLDGIMYGICYAVTVTTGINNGIVNSDAVLKYLNN
jgi:hypothetical protein